MDKNNHSNQMYIVKKMARDYRLKNNLLEMSNYYAYSVAVLGISFLAIFTKIIPIMILIAPVIYCMYIKGGVKAKNSVLEMDVRDNSLINSEKGSYIFDLVRSELTNSEGNCERFKKVYVNVFKNETLTTSDFLWFSDNFTASKSAIPEDTLAEYDKLKADEAKEDESIPLEKKTEA